MTDPIKAENRIVLGERVPLFSAPQITGGSFDLHVSAGRWVVLSFLGSPANPRAHAELVELLSSADILAEDHLVMGCVFTGPPEDIAKLKAIGSNALFFLTDYDGAISRSFGAAEMPRSTARSADTSIAIATTSTPARGIGALPSRSISTATSTAAI
jgi:peroxiredoxin